MTISVFQPHSLSRSRMKRAFLESAGVPATCGSAVRVLSRLRACSGVGTKIAFASASSSLARDAAQSQVATPAGPEPESILRD